MPVLLHILFLHDVLVSIWCNISYDMLHTLCNMFNHNLHASFRNTIFTKIKSHQFATIFSFTMLVFATIFVCNKNDKFKLERNRTWISFWWSDNESKWQSYNNNLLFNIYYWSCLQCFRNRIEPVRPDWTRSEKILMSVDRTQSKNKNNYRAICDKLVHLTCIPIDSFRS